MIHFGNSTGEGLGLTTLQFLTMRIPTRAFNTWAFLLAGLRVEVQASSTWVSMLFATPLYMKNQEIVARVQLHGTSNPPSNTIGNLRA